MDLDTSGLSAGEILDLLRDVEQPLRDHAAQAMIISILCDLASALEGVKTSLAKINTQLTVKNG